MQALRGLGCVTELLCSLCQPTCVSIMVHLWGSMQAAGHLC